MVKKMDDKKIKEQESNKKETRAQERIKENKLLVKILLVIGFFFLVIMIAFFSMKSSTHPKYNGVTFNMIQEGELTFYETSFNVMQAGKPAVYNIYLRNSPKKLEKDVAFEGELELRNIMVLNSTTENLFCEGDWNLAIGNLLNLNIFNIEIMKDENASCSEGGEYMFVQIEEGEETRIEQFGPSCYKLIVNDCEILPATERFMIEVFSEVNALLNK